MIAIDPVIAPATSLSAISVQFDAIEIAAARVLRGGVGFSTPAGPRVIARLPTQSRKARAARPRWLIASFSATLELGHRPAIVAVGRHERRVVAEAAVAARLRGELALAALGEDARLAPGSAYASAHTYATRRSPSSGTSASSFARFSSSVASSPA